MVRAKTTEEFIQQARQVHGDKYDYSQVEYVNGRTAVKVICRDHGEFPQRPAHHLDGHGCPRCAGVPRKETKQFIHEARAVHGSRYDYSQVKYVSRGANVIIVCPEHGPFPQVPKHHLKGSGCPKCYGNAPKTTDEFIEQARAVHGEFYDYSQVQYTNTKTGVKIICPTHGIFEQSPEKHLAGHGCRECGIARRPEARRKSQHQFIREAKAKHGDRYDYSKVKYTGHRESVTIICPKHGEFGQHPIVHLRGHGCPKCKLETIAAKALKGTKKFIQEATAVHGDKYDYSLVEYKGSHTHVTIICPHHGEFKQTPTNHLRGHACEKCAGVARKNTELFVQQARSLHGDLYDYSQVEYVNDREKVDIICPKHGLFEQSPSHHLQGKGCKDCAVQKSADTRRRSLDAFISLAHQVHGDVYDYSQVQYGNPRTPITIVCRTHGSFRQLPDSHIRGHGCEQCGIEKAADARRMELSEFIAKARQIHADLYDYSQVEYVATHIPVKIICREHGVFEQAPAKHLSGQRCPWCKLIPRSKEEIVLACELLAFFDFDPDHHKLFIQGKLVDVDIMIPEANLIVEFDGSYWHRKKQHIDRRKTEQLVQAGWRVVRAREEPLQAITEYCVVVPQGNHKEVANRVLVKITDVWGIAINGLNHYLKRDSLANEDMANRRIAEMLSAQAGQQDPEYQQKMLFD